MAANKEAVPGQEPAPASERTWQSFVVPSITLALFVGAAWAIHHELEAYSFAEITNAVGALSSAKLALALLAAALSYAMLAL